MKKRSWIAEMETLHDKYDNKEFNDHIIVALEVDSLGRPSGKVLKAKGETFTVLGMMDMAIHVLQSTKSKIMTKFDEVDAKVEQIKSASDPQRARLKALEERAREATKNHDYGALEKIQKELTDLLKEMKSDLERAFDDSDESESNDDDRSESGGFNLEDFKNGF
jgi:hypothetical protein